MFAAIGTFVHRMRFLVIAVLIVIMGGLGLYGLGLDKHLSQGGFFDDSSQSVAGSKLADKTFGRDHKSDVIVLITPPAGTTVDNAQFGAKAEKFVSDLIAKYPTIVNRDKPGIVDPFLAGPAQSAIRKQLFSDDKQHAFISIGVAGDDDTAVLNNYKTIKPALDNIAQRYDLPGTTFKVSGLQPIANALSNGMADDVARAEIIALPLVAIMLFFIFGGVVAAILPVLIGGLTIAGATGIMNGLAQVIDLNIFAQPVITLIGLGIAIDYGLFIVSRFREELAEGYPPPLAVKRAVMTAGQTVAFSATIIIAALACLLIFPQGFLKSVAYGAVSAVALAALLSITVLPAILAILGHRIDMLGFKFLRRTKTRSEVEGGFWGKLAGWVMRHPVRTAVPVVLILLVLIVPFSGIKFGGITEKYLPPGNSERAAQEDFDRIFPTQRTQEVKLIVTYDTNSAADQAKLVSIANAANKIPGFTKQFTVSSDDGAQSGVIDGTSTGVVQMAAGLDNDDIAGDAVKALRKIDTQGLKMYVAGTPALTQDSINALLDDLPWMTILLVVVTFVLMFLAFGSVVLPIKAALMSALGLGSTLGILTWIFIDGHGASLGNFTPGPLMSAVLVLIIAIIYGLSTDYEVFLLSRMVEARQKGASTTEAVRVGTAHTGRIITAAAAILVVVTGAFGLSEIVMMKYIAYGMIAALVLDATVIRMLLVPAVMKLLGDDCWWAPAWMRTVQRKIGLGETVLDDELGRERDAGTVATTVPSFTGADQMSARPQRSPRSSGVPPFGAAPGDRSAVRGSFDDRHFGESVDQRGAIEHSGVTKPADSSRVQGSRPSMQTGNAFRRTPPPYPAAAPTTSSPGTAPREEVSPRAKAPHPGVPHSIDQPSTPTTRGTAPRVPAPGSDRNPYADVPSRPATVRGNPNGPDTGGWSLGDSGIRLQGAIDADAATTPATNDVPPTPTVSRPSSPRQSDQPLSDDARPTTSTRGGDRHAKYGSARQISVQELLRRSAAEQEET